MRYLLFLALDLLGCAIATTAAYFGGMSANPWVAGVFVGGIVTGLALGLHGGRGE